MRCVAYALRDSVYRRGEVGKRKNEEEGKRRKEEEGRRREEGKRR